jgi:hypothetical protein
VRLAGRCGARGGWFVGHGYDESESGLGMWDGMETGMRGMGRRMRGPMGHLTISEKMLCFRRLYLGGYTQMVWPVQYNH